MKKAWIWMLVACLPCALLSCGPKPEKMNEQEQRVFDALVMTVKADPSISSIRINGIDTGFLPEHLNIDMDVTFTKNGEEETVLARLALQSGSLTEDPYGCYSDTGEGNGCMKILNINYALEQYFKGS